MQFLNLHLTMCEMAEEASKEDRILLDSLMKIISDSIRILILLTGATNPVKNWSLVQSLVISNFVYTALRWVFLHRRASNLNFQNDVNNVGSMKEQTHRTLTYDSIHKEVMGLEQKKKY